MNVHIKISDKNWIIEKCASEIAKAGVGITYDTCENKGAKIQYYMTYSSRNERVSQTELAFFTHMEEESNAKAKFFSVAAQVEHCVTMAKRYSDVLLNHGVSDVTQIRPGVDLNIYKPRLKIGVVGRTYHTGRKGESLINSVINIPDIEWRFTGAGWPSGGNILSEDEIVRFYNDLDYVLIPSHIEGGPMSIVEAIACGKKVIAPDVGWVPDYPHISFEKGDAQSLKVVLEKLFAEKIRERTILNDQTWSIWAESHIRLFEKLDSRALNSGKSSKQYTKVAMVTHGSESGNLGGPTIRVPETAKYLSEYNVDAVYSNINSRAFKNNLVHVFNVWEPATCSAIVSQAKLAYKSVILSPIFLNLSNHNLFSKTIPQIFQEHKESIALSKLAQINKKLFNSSNYPVNEIFPGYHQQVKSCIEMVDGVILLSSYEKECLEYIGCKLKNSSIVKNAISSNRFPSVERGIFKSKFGLGDYVLCVGRIEPRKNQLLLAIAAKQLGINVVFIGHPVDKRYYDLVKKHAGVGALFINRLDPGSALLASAFQDAKLFCLPSWSEGAPLSALEANLFNLPLILSSTSGEKEYFSSDVATFVHPADFLGLKKALSYGMSNLSYDKLGCKNNISFGNYLAGTRDAYINTLNLGQSTRKPDKLNTKNVEVYIFDVTDFLYANGRPAGIPRVIEESFKSLASRESLNIKYIAWKLGGREFYEIPKDVIESGNGLKYLQSSDYSLLVKPNITEFDKVILLCFAGAWAAHTDYCAAVVNIKSKHNILFILMIHDLVRIKYAYLYPKSAADTFHANAGILFPLVDRFLVYSATTKLDLIRHLHSRGFVDPDIQDVCLGESHVLDVNSSPIDDDVRSNMEGRKFILYVSSFDKRKNHLFLLNVWRDIIRLSDSPPTLVLVGKQMWDQDFAIYELNHDKSLSRYVKHYVSISDSTLDWLYRNCQFTVFPSIYEGWGLPVSESLKYGKFCITTTGSATAEIAPNLVELLSPFDHIGWVNVIEMYSGNEKLLSHREELISKRYSPKSWDDSVNSVLKATEKFYLSSRSLPALLVNTLFMVNKKSANDLMATTGVFDNTWSPCETSGIWSLAINSNMHFLLYTSRESFHTLYLKISSLDNIQLKISCNNITIYKCIVGRSQTPHYINFETILNQNNNAISLDIEFSVDKLLSPVNYGSVNDRRNLGILLHEFGVFGSKDIIDSILNPSSAEIYECDEKDALEDFIGKNFDSNEGYFKIVQHAFRLYCKSSVTPDQFDKIYQEYKSKKNFNLLISNVKSLNSN